MVQFVLYGLLLFAAAIDAGFFGRKKVPINIAAEARRLVHQGKWATFSSLSADGYPLTTVLSTADNHNGEIFFYVLNADIPTMDTSKDNRITFTFSDVAKVRFRIRADEPTYTTAMISGHVKKLESGTEYTHGMKAFLFHHPEAFEWGRFCLLKFSLCKLDVTNVLVFSHNGEVGATTPQEFYAATDSDATSESQARQIGTRLDIAAEARRLVYQAKWATSTIILTDGYPMTTVLSTTTDSKGDIFFYLLDVDLPAMDINNGSRITLMFSDAQEVDCNDGGDDPWSPNCARAVIWGCVKKLEVGTEEHNRSLEVILTRHPTASEFSTSTSPNFFLYKLDITNVVVLYRYGGGGQVTSQEYYAKVDSVAVDAYLMKQIGARPDIAAEARRLVHQETNVTTVIYLGAREAVIYFLPTADRKGQIYFYVSNTNLPAMDTNKNNTFVFSDPQSGSCNNKRGSTWSPHCAQAMISGHVRKLDVGTEEHNRSMNVFLWRHPTASDWGSSGLDFFLWKLDITRVKVEFRYGTSHFVTSEEYYAGTESVHTNVDSV